MNQDYLVRKYNLDASQPNPVIVGPAGRAELVELWKELGFKVGLEVGVQRGDFALEMLKNIPDLKYYGVDAWTCYEGYKDIIASRHGQGSFDRLYEEAKEKLKDYSNVTLIRKWSTEAAKDFEDESLDFVYIDGNHDFYHTVEDINAWLPKIKKDGIISGHDYARVNKAELTIHCKDAVDGWTSSHGDKLFVFYKQRSPNWLWFKQ
jgi:ABC-type amino acid transport substrate-binding protein